MAYAHPVIRATLFGTMFNGAEEWSTGFFLGHPGAAPDAPSEAAAADIWTAWSAFFNSNAAGISWAWHATGVKLVTMKTDGKADIPTTVTHHPQAAAAGGNQVTGFPPQVALVASLIGGVGKGVGMKGRMYIPGVCHPIMGTGHMAWDKVQGVATAFQTFANAINASANVPGLLINASQGNTAKGYAPVNKPITEIRIGSVYDTQRRRRNQLAEGYDSRAVTAG